MLIKSGTLIKIGCHVDQSFELIPLLRNQLRKQKLKQDIEVRFETSQKAQGLVTGSGLAEQVPTDKIKHGMTKTTILPIERPAVLLCALAGKARSRSQLDQSNLTNMFHTT